MGRTKGMYRAEFPVGSRVQIAGSGRLAEFRHNWQYHHPLADDQLSFGGTEAKILEVAFYHGGDELYTLGQVPGIWHEVASRDCLQHRTYYRPANVLPSRDRRERFPEIILASMTLRHR
jgi:hypothetical protein